MIPRRHCVAPLPVAMLAAAWEAGAHAPESANREVFPARGCRLCNVYPQRRKGALDRPRGTHWREGAVSLVVEGAA